MVERTMTVRVRELEDHEWGTSVDQITDPRDRKAIVKAADGRLGEVQFVALASNAPLIGERLVVTIRSEATG